MSFYETIYSLDILLLMSQSSQSSNAHDLPPSYDYVMAEMDELKSHATAENVFIRVGSAERPLNGDDIETVRLIAEDRKSVV